MNKQEAPVPINRGSEIQAQKLIETIKQKLKMLETWHADIGRKMKDKEVLYNREFMKDADKRNYALIADLSEEIETLSNAANQVFDEMLKADDLVQTGKEQLREFQELSDEIERIAVLEANFKDESENK